jgi:signal transduction histidine kinase
VKYSYKSCDRLLRRILNMHMSRIVSFVVGLISLALLVCVEIALMSIMWHGDISLLVVALVSMSIAISAPFIWWCARGMVTRLLSPKIVPSNRQIPESSLVHESRKELDALQEQFISVASHELRTPLTTVHGYIELLCEHYDSISPETRIEFLKKARAGCDELNLMVNNIIDVHLVPGDVARIHLHPISLRLVILHVLEMLNATIQRERRSVTIYIESDLLVCADNLRLRQILLNLISNALKYSAPGTRIEVSALRNDMDVHISVRDYGFGVPPEKQRHIFERFMRLERDMNSPVRGAGLGLYICQQFVNALGGRIWVESSGRSGEGCVFTFILRYASLDQSQQVEVVKLPAW